MKRMKFLMLVAILGAFSLTANAQKWNSNPDDSATCVLNTSLYSQAYKIKAYDEAYEPWRQVVDNCPKSSRNLYIRGVNILKYRINEAAKAQNRERYDSIVTELMELYEIRAINFPDDAADCLGKKAYDMEQLTNKKRPERYYPLYKEAIDKAGTKLDGVYVYRFFEATLAYVAKGLGDTTMIIDNYDIASELLEAELVELLSKDTTNLSEKQRVEDSTLISNTRKYLASVEASFSPFASCEQLVKIYSKKFEADPDNVTLLKKITNIMRKKGCTKEDLFFQAAERLYSIEPSPATAYMMGQMCYSKDKFSDAVKYLRDAVEGIETPKDRYAAYMLMGAAQGEMGSYSAARTSYYEAAKIDGTKGDPYLRIAGLYAKGARSIDDGLGGRTAYWAAVDKAVRAKSIDNSPEVVEAANRLIGTYSSYYPKQSDAFMLDLVDGNSYYVGGWIGESTTVRTRK